MDYYYFAQANLGPTLFLDVQNAVLRHDLRKVMPDPISE